MSIIIIILSLAFLIIAAYRGYSVILFAPIAALLAVMAFHPAAVAPVYTNLFMAKTAEFVKSYFPVFMLGALFGKVVECSGFSKSIVESTVRFAGARNAILSVAIVSALLTYGGVSVFVVVFAVYGFAAQMFRECNIPKRLIPGTIGLGAFTFAIDALPGSPQVQNIIPTTFFGTDTWAAPVLGIIGSLLILVLGIFYLNLMRARAEAKGEGYSTDGVHLVNEPDTHEHGGRKISFFVAVLPLVVVCLSNKLLSMWIPRIYGKMHTVALTQNGDVITTSIDKVVAVWAVEAALVLGIVTVLMFAWRQVFTRFAETSKVAVSGALLASLNTASEYGYGAVIASLPGFALVSNSLSVIQNPLMREAVSITTLAGITGSATGGLSIALGAMGKSFIESARMANIPMEVLHRIGAMAAGGFDTLPHNGAVITLLAVTGLTHRQSYKDIFAITCIKAMVVVVVILFYYMTGIH
ncbi:MULTISPECIES: GntP family permease [unclassified Burkholderia]|uniref:GntP family permease n=1 Tax=unclassified Burkholderia TaxID=2613784 RepID=UPI002AB0E4F4|nr:MULTISPECIES: GntP family permease [unclassified Burkholderia]